MRCKTVGPVLPCSKSHSLSCHCSRIYVGLLQFPLSILTVMTTNQDLELLIRSISVLEHVLAIGKITEVVNTFPELTNALNDNLDLAQKLTEDNNVPALLGPKLWKKVMSSAYSRYGGPENQMEILSVLSDSLKTEGIVDIIKGFPECDDALIANQNLASAIVNEGSTSQMMGNDLWRDLISIMQGQKSQKVQEKEVLVKDSEYILTGVKGNQGLMCELEQVRGEMKLLTKLIDCTFRESIPVELALKLLPVARQYGMESLSKRLVTVLGESLTVENCIRIFQKASTAEVDALWKRAQDAISYNFKLVSKNAHDFGQLTFGELCVFVFSKTLTTNEEDVFDAICTWIKADLETRRCHVPALLQAVRFTCCSLETLQRIKDHFLVLDQNEVHSVLESLILLETNSPGHLEKYSKEDRRSGPTRSDWFQWSPPDDVLFVMGGQDMDTEESIMEAYNYKHNIWIEQLRIPNPPRGQNICVAIGHCIFVVEYKQRRVRSFNTLTKSWNFLCPMPKFRQGVCLAQVGRSVYAMGGKIGLDQVKMCHVYDSQTDTWTDVPELNQQRNFAAASSFNGLVYCSGGYDGVANHSSVEVFDPTKNTWTFVSPMVEPRQAHCLVNCGDYLWAVGGINMLASTNVLERYNPITDMWTVMSPMPTPRFDLSAAVLKGRIFTIGGEKGFGDPTDITEIYDPALDRWSTGSKICKPRTYTSACAIHSLANALSYTTYN